MDITREYLMEQRDKLLQQAEQQQADLNQTLGAIRWTEHLIRVIEDTARLDAEVSDSAGDSAQDGNDG